MKNLFSTKKAIFAVGILIGLIAVVMQKMGNPANMGVCVACFARDIAGALGLHRAALVQYLRPEIIGFVLGALVSAVAFKEFKPRAGSAPVVRFVLGFFAAIGALVFLGCPWRALLRLAGGDANAIAGIAGLVAGIWIGILFLKAGFNLGRSQPTYMSAGLIMPAIMFGLLILAIVQPQLATGPVLFSSKEGPGSMHAPLFLSLAAGLVIGMLAQRTRFCTIGAVRDVILVRDFYLMAGVCGLILGACIGNLLLGQFHPGMVGQPIAHTDFLWNFTGMVLAGLAFTLAGGCPGRQLFMSGEGDGDAAVFVFGLLAGAAFAHNFGIAASPKGIGEWTPLFVTIGLAACLTIGLTMRKKM
jgi:uncharacterized protein